MSKPTLSLEDFAKEVLGKVSILDAWKAYRDSITVSGQETKEMAVVKEGVKLFCDKTITELNHYRPARKISTIKRKPRTPKEPPQIDEVKAPSNVNVPF